MKRAACLCLTLALALLAGCGKETGPSSSSSTAASSEPAAGGELVFAFDGAAASSFPLDPHLQPSYAPTSRILRSIYDSLVVALPGHRFGPWLATAWETSPDGRSTTFRLRQDVTFHDGTRFDAAAVKANFDRIFDPKNALGSAKEFLGFKQAVVLDEFSVRLDFEQPYAPLLAQLSKTHFGIASPAAIAQYGSQLGAHPVGSGPFRLARVVSGTEIQLERFDAYRWAPEGSQHPGPAFLEKLTFKSVPEEATRVAVLQSGEAQAADLIPPQNLVNIRNDPDVRVVEGELLNHNYTLRLNTRRPPWDDVRARRAFRAGLDVDAAIKTIYLGTATRAWSPLSPGLFAYDRTLENTWGPDRAAAGRALEELGWKPGPDGIRVKDGKRLTVVCLDGQGNREKRIDLLTVFRRQLKEVGIDLRIESQPGGNYLEKIRNGDFDLAAGSQFTTDPDVLRTLYTPDSSYARIDDAELTGWLRTASQRTDPAERLALYARAQHHIIDAVCTIPTYVLLYTVTTPRRVHDVRIDTAGFPQFHEAWLEPQR
ncbi:ABC transporter substrate-binding protein [Xylophilus sp.]|uniref:ABC transporter substrate-binding protein n=1 Tax=Xylophilus sp. TaxID=2653893 RepID=UPI0013BB6D1E|nr:ABC transporter substrate-binding protein [Xylophilus sp.]KAF1042974.1 MAG: Glutathione-binding protein GsiB [Xylophilus sp.]